MKAAKKILKSFGPCGTKLNKYEVLIDAYMQSYAKLLQSECKGCAKIVLEANCTTLDFPSLLVTDLLTE